MFSAPSTEGTAVLGLSIKWTLQSSHKSIIDEQWYGILGQEEGKGRWEKWNWAGGGHWKGGSYLSKGRESGSLCCFILSSSWVRHPNTDLLESVFRQVLSLPVGQM